MRALNHPLPCSADRLSVPMVCQCAVMYVAVGPNAAALTLGTAAHPAKIDAHVRIPTVAGALENIVKPAWPVHSERRRHDFWNIRHPASGNRDPRQNVENC